MLKFIPRKFLKIFCPGVRKRIFNNVNMQWNLLGWHPVEWNRKTSEILWGYWASKEEERICRENNKEEFIVLGNILKRSYLMRQLANIGINYLASFLVCFAHLLALCVPRLWNTCIWRERSNRYILLPANSIAFLVIDLYIDTIQIQYILGTSHVPISILVTSMLFCLIFQNNPTKEASLGNNPIKSTLAKTKPQRA